MTTSLYDMTMPLFVRGFASLSDILKTAEAFAADKGIDAAELTGARLFEDMAPLPGQVQRASDSAKGCFVRLGQVENLVLADEEQTFADLQARIAATVGFLQSVPREAIDGREDADVVLKVPNVEIPFKGIGYVQGFVIPNFYFHVTTAYAILRHKGVPIGKRDYLGRA